MGEFTVFAGQFAVVGTLLSIFLFYVLVSLSVIVYDILTMIKTGYQSLTNTTAQITKTAYQSSERNKSIKNTKVMGV